jgi:hypothetical protein
MYRVLGTLGNITKQLVLTGFNIMIERQRQMKYSVSNIMARGATGHGVTGFDVACPQE